MTDNVPTNPGSLINNRDRIITRACVVPVLRAAGPPLLFKSLKLAVGPKVVLTTQLIGKDHSYSEIFIFAALHTSLQIHAYCVCINNEEIFYKSSRFFKANWSRVTDFQNLRQFQVADGPRSM